MTDPTPDETPQAPGPRHRRADVLTALSRVEHLLELAEGRIGLESLPIRLGHAGEAPGRPPIADAWNLRVIVEELRAQIAEADDRAAHRPMMTVAVRPVVETEDLEALASAAAKAIAARLVGTGPGPVGITSAPADRLDALEQAVKFLADTTSNGDDVVDTADKFARFLTLGQAGARRPMIPRMVSSTRLAAWLDERPENGDLLISTLDERGNIERDSFRIPTDHLRRIVGYLEEVKADA